MSLARIFKEIVRATPNIEENTKSKEDEKKLHHVEEKAIAKKDEQTPLNIALAQIHTPDKEKRYLKPGHLNDANSPSILISDDLDSKIRKIINIPKDKWMRYEEILWGCSEKASELNDTIKKCLDVIKQDKETATPQEMIEKIKNDATQLEKYEEYRNALLDLATITLYFDHFKAQNKRTDAHYVLNFPVLLTFDLLTLVIFMDDKDRREVEKFAIDVIELMESPELVSAPTTRKMGM